MYDLHDSHKNAVVINDGKGNNVVLAPGRSAALAKLAVNSFEEVNPAQFVCYRHLTSRVLSCESKIYEAEFDIMSMVRGLPPLGKLVASDSAQTRKAMMWRPRWRHTRCLRSARVMNQILSKRSPLVAFGQNQLGTGTGK